jgi:hypothetical protein
VNNPLTDVMTPRIRKIVYFLYALVGLAVGAIQAGYGAVNAAVPDWLKIALAVYAFLGIGIGATAGSNVKDPARASGPAPSPSTAPEPA